MSLMSENLVVCMRLLVFFVVGVVIVLVVGLQYVVLGIFIGGVDVVVVWCGDDQYVAGQIFIFVGVC